jgi:DNA-binding response OmpR family regulator
VLRERPVCSRIFRFADVEVREREFTLTKAGQTLSVEPKAFRVLLILLRNPRKLLSKDELLTAVWGDTAVSENSLARSVNEERVADLKDWHITGFLTTWMALDPTDNPMLLRDVGTDDIYALTLETK